MSNVEVTYIIAAICGGISFIAYVGLILVPAWGSYGRTWERCAAAFLSLYVLAAMTLIGVGLGTAVIWSYDRFF